MNDYKKFLKTINCEDMTLEEVLEETDTYPVTLESITSDLQDPDTLDDQKLVDAQTKVAEYLRANPNAKVYQHVWNDMAWQYVAIDGTEVAFYHFESNATSSAEFDREA